METPKEKCHTYYFYTLIAWCSNDQFAYSIMQLEHLRKQQERKMFLTSIILKVESQVFCKTPSSGNTFSLINADKSVAIYQNKRH